MDIDANTVVETSGSYEIGGYVENDYFNGTGAWVTTYVSVFVDTLEVFTYNEDGEQVANTYKPNIHEISEYVAEYLWYR